MKKYGKKLAATTLALGMVFAMGTTAFAASDAEYTKNENVYVSLEQDGDVQGAYVVNVFNVTRKGEITDYGDYSKVQNLTNLDPIETDKDEQTFTAEKGKFYYQGDVEKAELPWEFDIQYRLDGDELEPEELAGAEGDLKIRINIRKNPAYTREDFFEGYLLQVSLTLDPSLCDNIHAEGGTISDAGADENIIFLVNPETETDLTVTAEVTDFEMDDISINGTAAVEMPLSYASAENTEMGKTTFIISAEGVSIPEPEPEPITEEESGFLEKLLDLFKSLFD